MLVNMHWEEKSLGSLCELTNGYAFKPSDWGTLGKPIIRIQNLNGGQDFNYFQGSLPERYEVKTGTLLFAWSGNRGTSFGPFIWNGPNGFLNQHIFKVTPKDGINENWFYFALDDVRQRVEKKAHGAIGLVHVRKQDLCKYIVPVPINSCEQRAIAAILDTMDEAIRRTEALIAKLRQVKAGMLHDLLTRGLDENGELRDPIRHPEQFKDSPLGKVPKEWPCQQMREALLKPPRNGFSPKEASSFTGAFVLGLGCLTADGFETTQLKPINLTDVHKENILQDGDLLISRSNTSNLVAFPGVFKDFGYVCTYPDLMMRLNPKPYLLAQFLELMMRYSKLRDYLVRNANGTSASMVKINATTVGNAPIVLPELPEQERILAVIDSFNEKLSLLYREHEKLVLIKQGLMQDLLTDRVRVPEAMLQKYQTEVAAE